MIRALKEAIKARWPRLRLRSILFATLFFVAALPGVGAVFLRVYENTLVRQTEAELAAQGAALAATASALWPGDAMPAAVPQPPPPPARGGRYPPPRSTIDLNATPILPERPAATKRRIAPDPAAVAAMGSLRAIFVSTTDNTLASILLVDRFGNVLNGADAGGSYAELAEIAAAMHGHSVTTLRRNGAYRQVYRFEWLSRAAAIRVHHARPIVVQGRVVGVVLLSRTARALFRGLYEDRGKILVGILAIFGVLVVLTAMLSRGIARPIEALSGATRAVAAGGRGAIPDVPPTAALEIQSLYVDFAAMAKTIERRSRYLRDFAHAVSHEFKTPLAGIRGAIELLRDHGGTMSVQDRERFLANADADAQRLTLLVTRLLELARADMTQAQGGAVATIGAVVAGITDAERGLAVMLHDPERIAAAMPPETLATILSALIENSRQAGATQVRIETRSEQDRAVILLRDNGPGIPAADRGRIFEPFFTTRRGSGGTGLGLPIVRSLIEAHGGVITMPPGDATLFHIELPLPGKGAVPPC